MLSLDSIHTQRGGRVLCREISLSIDPGQAIILKGENGSGKTTLLSVLAGIIPAQRGSILWQGREVPQKLLPFISEFIGTANAVNERHTVTRALGMHANMRGARGKLKAAMAFWQLDDIAHMRVSSLSSGWRKKLSLARLLLSDKPVWLLDEPMTYLDEESRNRLLSMIATHCDGGGIAIISSHMQNLPFGREIHISSATILDTDSKRNFRCVC